MSKKIYKVVFINYPHYLRNTIPYHVEADNWKEAGDKAEKRYDKDYPDTEKFIIETIELTDIEIIS